jgi:hypothetical protein
MGQMEPLADVSADHWKHTSGHPDLAHSLHTALMFCTGILGVSGRS